MRRALTLAALAWAVAGGAFAQVTAYPPAFFAEARPATALDMVERLPGFTFEEGDEDVRGYAGSGGNVLIDGQRPTSKRDTLDDILARIPAAAVERIELIRGGAPGIDMEGRTVLANVVRKSESATEGLVAAGADIHPHTVLPSISLEGSRRWNGHFAEATLSYAEELDDETGEGERLRYAPALTRRSALDEDTKVRTAELKGGYEYGSLRANAALLGEWTRSDLTEQRTFPSASLETVSEDEDLIQGEAGLRYERALGGAKLDLVAIQQLGWLDAEETSWEDGETERFTEDTTFGETIVRAALHMKRWEIGAEAAFNYLESRTALEEDGVPQPLPGANVRVEERRAEAFAAATWKPDATLAIETALRFEVSEITQTGAKRRFTYPKPRLALTWSPSDTQQVRLRIEREVGQLDFGDFVASASLDEGAISAGAADLEPAKTWVLEAAWERHFLKDGALVLTVRHEAISDVVDRVLFTGPGFALDAPDNIGDGRRDSLEAALTLPLGKGRLFTAKAAWRDTEVTDPTTGDKRRISAEEPFTGEIALTQDFARWSWGIEASLPEREPEYRFDEVRLEGEETWIEAFVELRPADRWRVRIEAQNLTARDTWLQRDVYDGPRDTAPLDYQEQKSVTFEPYLSVRVRRTLGGL